MKWRQRKVIKKPSAITTMDDEGEGCSFGEN